MVGIVVVVGRRSGVDVLAVVVLGILSLVVVLSLLMDGTLFGVFIDSLSCSCHSIGLPRMGLNDLLENTAERDGIYTRW